MVLILECNEESIFAPMAGIFLDKSDIHLSKNPKKSQFFFAINDKPS